MKIGAIFPQTEMPNDPVAIRDFAQAVESLGFDHLVAFDHVIGANAASRPGWSGPYRHTDSFYEPFVLFGYLAALTKSIELVTGIIILPQRQTTLVAKQTATLDVLCNGRLRLGIGIGWNDVEFEALGENFRDRGIRSEEQMEVMRALWTQELVTFDGRWHKITDAGINPLPVQRPIPIWIGGRHDRVLRRIARLADGWFPLFPADDTGRELMDRLWEYVRQEGRDPASIGIEAWISVANKQPDQWVREAEAWKELGATHISVGTMKAGYATVDGHIDAIRLFKEALAGM